jgi:Lrp/AsnC family transcriptional regulator for asnA, asnC and gidA
MPSERKDKKNQIEVMYTDILDRWQALDLRLLPIDDVDIKIMSKLLENARRSNSDIAKDLNLSEATVRRRIKNLVDKGIIRGFSIFIDYRLIENTVKAYVHIKVQSDVIDKIIKKISQHKRVIALYRVTGSYDLLCVALFVGMPELQDFMDSYLKMDGVREVETQIIMTAYKGVPWTGY